jgi:hypothetical protein
MQASNLSETIIERTEMFNQSLSHLKESFSLNSQATFSNLFPMDFDEQIDDQFATTKTVLNTLIQRELKISASVARLFKYNNRDSWETVQIYSEKFAQFIERFIFL